MLQQQTLIQFIGISSNKPMQVVYGCEIEGKYYEVFKMIKK